jgi:hypothetical protein
MTASDAPARLDELSADLARAVRHAAGARAAAAVAAAFEGLTRDVNAVACQIEEHVAVLRRPSPLPFSPELGRELGERSAWLFAQIKKVREVAESSDPMRVRQGALWRETLRAATTLRNDLADGVDQAYKDLLDPFRGRDREILETLPQGVSGSEEYRATIDDFERAGATRPTKPEDVTNAVAIGRRLQRLREQTESTAVPPEFQDQWRLVRTTGLPLTALTESFAEWLGEQGLASATLLTVHAH